MEEFMKHILSVIVFCLIGIILISCDNEKGSPVQEAIKNAEKLSFSELVIKAKEEIGTNKLQVFGNSSALQDALDAFSIKTGIQTENTQLSDTQLFSRLITTIGAGTYAADMILAQDGNNIKSLLLNSNYVQTYIPREYKDIISPDDLIPATATLYLNKIFMYNNKDNTKNLLTNVWQLAGKNTDKGHLSNISFKSATSENVNMNFLIMLTSETWVKKLSSAYKDFYGFDYVSEPEYENIGYKFIREFIKNTTTHQSDTRSVEQLPSTEPSSIILANFNKIKGVKTDERPFITVAAYDNHINGFDGFVYKMYSLISSNSKYPYAACALINYLSSAEGYQKAWGGLAGYYSVNPNVSTANGDRNLAFWKSNCVIEDPNYVSAAYSTVFPFITSSELR
jgi:ABC-type Fe3+ transport system substrate-binding protein